MPSHPVDDGGVRRSCFKAYFANKFNLLRLFSLFITTLLLMTSCIHSAASIYYLSLFNIWCNEGKPRTWDEVVAHNIETGNSGGEGGCWRAGKMPIADSNRLFGTINGGFEKAVISLEIFNIIKMLLYGMIFGFLFYLFIKYSYQSINDCKKTVYGEW